MEAIEDGFKNIIIGSIMVVLFAFVVMSFVFTMAGNYGKDTTTLEQNSINLHSLNSTLNSGAINGTAWRTAFEKQNIFSPLTVGGLIFTTLFKIGVQMLGFVVNVFDLVFIQIFNNILHIPAIVTATFFVIMIISAILYLWRLGKAGD